MTFLSSQWNLGREDKYSLASSALFFVECCVTSTSGCQDGRLYTPGRIEGRANVETAEEEKASISKFSGDMCCAEAYGREGGKGGLGVQGVNCHLKPQ